MNLRHAPEPIQTQLAGNTLDAEFIGHCACGWRETAGGHLDYLHALSHTLDHIARMPEMWPEPPSAAA